MGLVWTNKLSVGNAIIDCEHRNLISMARDVRREISTRDIPAMLEAFRLLENWLRTHFANEEIFAQAIKFPFDQHRLAQQCSLKELQHIRDELVTKDGTWPDDAIKHFSRALKIWMIDEHILKLDMRMKPALQSHGHNFLPDHESSEADHKRGLKAAASNSRRYGCGCGCGCDGFADPAMNAAFA